MTITTTLKATVATVRDRRRAARAYAAAETSFNQTWDRVHVTGGTVDRAVLIGRLAERMAEMAALHTRAFGPDPIAAENNRPMADALAAGAELLAMAASAELALAASVFRPADKLIGGDTFEFAGEWAEVLAAEEVEPGITRVRFAMEDLGEGDSGIKTLSWRAGESVRVAGPAWADLEVTELADDYGITGDELREWQRLATQYDRDRRADILIALADLAKRRAGATAARVLRELAGAELGVLLPPPGPVDREIRAAVGATFIGIGLAVVVLAVAPVQVAEWPWIAQMPVYLAASISALVCGRVAAWLVARRHAAGEAARQAARAEAGKGGR